MFLDLNHLYFEHQIALMRASSARDAKARAGHQLAATGFAQRITKFQHGIGASNWRLQGSCVPAGGAA